MYHELTTTELERRRRWHIAVAVCLALVALLATFVLRGMREGFREQGAQAMRNSILSAARRCCAIEGSYPKSVDYLEERYGLRVNDRDYVVTYEYFAANVSPSVVVVPR